VVAFSTVQLPNFFPVVLVLDLQAQTLTLASRSLSGGLPEFGASTVSMSADGKTIAYESGSSDLVANDRNLLGDVFVYHSVTSTGGDTDSDGLADSWEISNFGDLSATANADADGDGLTNLQEYLSGTNPKDSASVLEFDFAGYSANQLAVTWKSTAGKSYQIQHRAALDSGTWADVGSVVVATGASTNLLIPLDSAPAGFYRVRLVP